jgi:hypothetical protein
MPGLQGTEHFWYVQTDLNALWTVMVGAGSAWRVKKNVAITPGMPVVIMHTSIGTMVFFTQAKS